MKRRRARVKLFAENLFKLWALIKSVQMFITLKDFLGLLSFLKIFLHVCFNRDLAVL